MAEIAGLKAASALPGEDGAGAGAAATVAGAEAAAARSSASFNRLSRAWMRASYWLRSSRICARMSASSASVAARAAGARKNSSANALDQRGKRDTSNLLESRDDGCAHRAATASLQR